MNRLLRIHARARKDLQHIFRWLQLYSARGAENWLNAYFEAVERIAVTPDSYPVAAEALPRWRRDCREALFKTPHGRRYRIVFELTDTEVRVLRIRGPGQPPLRRRDLPQ